MAHYHTKMQEFIAEEVKKVKGVAVPVHASFLERATVRMAKCSKLHPNPDDEFCFPEIGPSEEIVSNYEKEYRLIRDNPNSARFLNNSAKYPLTIQKIRPDGYMILNGHHRWIAAVRSGMNKIPVKIVNLTQEKDIRKMLERSKHEKRITLDLEEVVYSSGNNEPTEKPLPFPVNRFYRERIRLGIPALFAYCVSSGYDIWLYSSGYESMDYVRELMKHYHAPVTGIITGTAKKLPKGSDEKEKIEALIAAKYYRTIHADNDTVLCIDNRSKEYREFQLKKENAWSAEIIDIIGALDKNA